MQSVSRETKADKRFLKSLCSKINNTEKHHLDILTIVVYHASSIFSLVQTYCSILAIHTSPSDDCNNPQAISPVGCVTQLPVCVTSVNGWVLPPLYSPSHAIQVDDQQFRGEARGNKHLSYHIRVIWAHVEWGRGQRKHRATAEEAQHAPARLSGQSITGRNKRLAQSLVLNCTFVYRLTCLRALLCKSNFVKQDCKLFRWVAER